MQMQQQINMSYGKDGSMLDATAQEVIQQLSEEKTALFNTILEYMDELAEAKKLDELRNQELETLKLNQQILMQQLAAERSNNKKCIHCSLGISAPSDPRKTTSTNNNNSNIIKDALQSLLGDTMDNSSGKSALGMDNYSPQQSPSMNQYSPLLLSPTMSSNSQFGSPNRQAEQDRAKITVLEANNKYLIDEMTTSQQNNEELKNNNDALQKEKVELISVIRTLEARRDEVESINIRLHKEKSQMESTVNYYSKCCKVEADKKIQARKELIDFKDSIVNLCKQQRPSTSSQSEENASKRQKKQ